MIKLYLYIHTYLMESKGKYFNIEKLLENTENRNNLIESLIKLFVTKYEDKIYTFQQLSDNNHLNDLTDILHQLKSNLPYLAQPEIQQQINDLHNFSLHHEKEKVNTIIPSAITNLESLIHELKEYFLIQSHQ